MTDEEESSERLRDPVHVMLITCCVFEGEWSISGGDTYLFLMKSGNFWKLVITFG